MRIIKKFQDGEVLEYGLVLVVVIIAVTAFVCSLGPKIKQSWNDTPVVSTRPTTQSEMNNESSIPSRYRGYSAKN